MLRITEIFFSIQGEAKFLGLPTVFIRLTGCPMRCVYCDSAYAFHGGEKKSLADIIQQTKQYKTPYITITGGEPLAQPLCLDLMTSLCDQDFVVSLETGNAINIKNVDQRVHIVLDIKTPSSNEEKNNRYENLKLIKSTDQLKFVICNREDYEWSRKFIIDKAINEHCEVLFSPSAQQLEGKDLAEWILEDQLAVRFQTQLHKQLWGDIPGV